MNETNNITTNMSSQINATPPVNDLIEEPVSQELVFKPMPDVEPILDPMNVSEPVLQEPISQEPVSQEPVSQEPVSQEPVSQEPISQEPVSQEPVVEQNKKEITITTDKNTLTTLSQNLNANLLVTVTAYKAVLNKLKASISDTEKQTALETNINELTELEKTLSSLLVSVQQNLDAETKLDPANVIADGSTNFMQRLLNTEAIAVLGSIMAALPLLGGGSKHKKLTKRIRNKPRKGKKSTKRVVPKI